MAARPSYDTGRRFCVQATFELRMVDDTWLTVTTSFPLSASEQKIQGPILSLDLGTKRVGAAVSDPTQLAITRLEAIRRSNWKQLLLDVRELVRRFDPKTLVIGLPLSLDGSEGSAAKSAREIAMKFALSLTLPVYLQDERLTSREATERLTAAGLPKRAVAEQIDSESAAIILRDFIGGGQHKILIQRPLNHI
jgi:putative Holliday junction resolvase